MIDRIFGGDSFVAQSRALDATSLRQELIANNLANVNTPGYKRQDVTFETRLSRALGQRRSGSGASTVEGVRPEVVTQTGTSLRADGNNVDMETENVNAAINSLRYEALTQMVGGYFTGLKAAITGR
ncbi:MAG TPA: flagellar basal body rod protein FlgB [Chthonomonadaceae bacterium]|nr:flagellar basal body rod protein FlgB [Chthonomonadaceae bacterium]